MSQVKGIGFFNIKSGETHYARSEAQIQAYLNSSDLGINASRGQDKGWRIDPEWDKKIKNFRNNEAQMSVLIAKNGGQSPSQPQILYAIYGEQLRQEQQSKLEDSQPFEEEYLKAISDNRKTTKPTEATSKK